jgi:hypothetical protein
MRLPRASPLDRAGRPAQLNGPPTAAPPLRRRAEEMTTTAGQNRAIVPEAFDTLFNKRDYAVAEKFWSPDYIQHSAHIEPGQEGLFNLVKSLPDQSAPRGGLRHGRG